LRADEKLTAFLELKSAIRDCSLSKLFCNAAQSFGEEWETGLRLGLPGTTATNPKQEKK